MQIDVLLFWIVFSSNTNQEGAITMRQIQARLQNLYLSATDTVHFSVWVWLVSFVGNCTVRQTTVKHRAPESSISSI